MAAESTGTDSPTANEETANKVRARLQARLPEEIVVRAGPPREHALFPEEKPFVAKAIAKRRREYATGRWLARQALASLGIDSCSLPSLPNRAPSWPREAVGSITHCDDLVCVVVAKARGFRSLGIDAEQAGRLDEALFSRILTERELGQLRRCSEVERRHRATLLFCAKETVHKNVSPGWKLNLGFQDVSIELDLEETVGDGSFRVLPESELSARVPWERFVGTVVALPAYSITVGYIR